MSPFHAETAAGRMLRYLRTWQAPDGALHGADLNACSLSGLQFTWEPVAAWGDGGQGTRAYDLYWSRDGYAAPLLANATSPATFAPPDSAATTYRLAQPVSEPPAHVTVARFVELKGLAPGNYSLLVNVRDALAGRSQAARASFTVVN